MGHTVYYRTIIDRWNEFRDFLEAVCEGLGFRFVEGEDSVMILPECRGVEPLEIKKNGKGFVKTNLVEPCHSIYLLILHSVAFFGSVELWED
ncbi:TonB-dependent receptor [Thermococcus pacificus]|uniref:TonB-dependent receptor n=1 Tax=Thermococcus pacificus TaxID=71998 RepID=A0A218P6M3_9EURY|nr:TonB-dependent receptor [Thermococcus pacificus]ASJ06424.1 TonB-dependent receptor [Thermococcus pacificus]